MNRHFLARQTLMIFLNSETMPDASYDGSCSLKELLLPFFPSNQSRPFSLFFAGPDWRLQKHSDRGLKVERRISGASDAGVLTESPRPRAGGLELGKNPDLGESWRASKAQLFWSRQASCRLALRRFPVWTEDTV